MIKRFLGTFSKARYFRSDAFPQRHALPVLKRRCFVAEADTASPSETSDVTEKVLSEEEADFLVNYLAGLVEEIGDSEPTNTAGRFATAVSEE
ncbi:hypothetical protein [Slackia heliotrinireducens]|jgi:hypothetical protein|uniref:hypothetical protein n=1 Tax=Slackia heliotrinireducens TaxID=84110 RepID=UPI0033155265